jgi:low temperature requirement protein LtrA
VLKKRASNHAGADELTIAYPTDSSSPPLMALMLGGPALYLAGNALFNWALSGRIPWSRLVAIAGIVALMPLSAGASALTLLIAATLVLVSLVGWDLRSR